MPLKLILSYSVAGARTLTRQKVKGRVSYVSGRDVGAFTVLGSS